MQHCHVPLDVPSTGVFRTTLESWERAFVGLLIVCTAAAARASLGSLADARPDGWIDAATGAAILLAALISSIAGFAFSALAGSALAYLRMDPVEAVQTMAVCSFAMQLYAVWQMRESVRWRSIAPMIAAGAATIPLGVWLLVHTAGPAYTVGLGLFLTIYGCYILRRRKTAVVRGTAWHDALAGALGGLAGGLAGIPAPFVTIRCTMRGLSKLEQRAIYQPYILAMQIVTIACLWRQAPTTLHIGTDLCLVPFALVGAMGGLALFRRLSNNQFQWIVSVLLVVSGVGLLARAL
jgi:uncharacterized protein